MATESTHFTYLFDNPLAAISFGLRLHVEFLSQPWNASVLEVDCCAVERDYEENQKVLNRGPRLKVGIEVGPVVKVFFPTFFSTSTSS